MVTKTQKTIDFKLVPRIESSMKEVEEGVEDLIKQIADLTSKSLYFGLGTVVILKEEVEKFYERAVKKGEESQKDILKMFKFTERKTKKAEATLETQIETRVRKVLDTFNVPSKSDVERLNRRVAELSNRVAQLNRPPARKKIAPKKAAPATATAA